MLPVFRGLAEELLDLKAIGDVILYGAFHFFFAVSLQWIVLYFLHFNHFGRISWYALWMQHMA